MTPTSRQHPLPDGVGAAPRQEDTALEIWTSAALGVVQQALRQQGKPPIAVTEKTLLQQLREDGVLLGATISRWRVKAVRKPRARSRLAR